MKKPATIDSTIDVRIYSHAMLIPPHKEEDFNKDDETEVLYAKAMDLVSDGKPMEAVPPSDEKMEHLKELMASYGLYVTIH